MNTYAFRLRFFIHSPGVIQNSNSSFYFDLPSGTKAVLKSIDSTSINNSKELVLSAGNYRTELEAAKAGAQMKTALLLSGPKLHIGIDAGRDRASFMVSDYIKSKVFADSGTQVIDNVHGVTVYKEDHPITTFSASATGLVSPSSAEKFTDVLYNIYELSPTLSDKVSLALELYGAAHYETSARARFITLVLATEALLTLEDRDDSVKQLVDKFIDLATNSGLPKKEVDSIKGSLMWLYKQSISQGLKELAQKYLGHNEYEGMSAVKFISYCYDVRSKLVHTGGVNESVIHLDSVAAQMQVFVADLLLGVTDVRSK